jgi:hypothetical protein
VRALSPYVAGLIGPLHTSNAPLDSSTAKDLFES